MICILGCKQEFQGDEGRYVAHAKFLTQGYYSPSGKDVFLYSGPGYPFILYPFAKFNISWFWARLLNPFLLFFAVVFFYKTLLLYISINRSYIYSLLFGAYLPFIRHLHLLLSETLVIFLMTGFIYFFCKMMKNRSYYDTILCIFFLGYLALTKVFFGYVILSMLLVAGLLFLFYKKRLFKKSLIVFLFAFFMCVPYLLYTYSLTGRFFYWGNISGVQLYYMSSPYDTELGNWMGDETIHKCPDLFKHHIDLHDSLKNMSLVEIDDALKKQAISNIRNHPKSYMKNIIANIGRLLFNYPYTNTLQKLSTYFYMIPNMFIVVLSFMFIYPTILNRKINTTTIIYVIYFYYNFFCRFYVG